MAEERAWGMVLTELQSLGTKIDALTGQLAAYAQTGRDLERRVGGLEVREETQELQVRALEDRVGPIDPKEGSVMTRLRGLERTVGDVRRLAWVLVAAIASTMAPALLQAMKGLLAMIKP